MRIARQDLIDDLLRRTYTSTSKVRELKQLPVNQLNFKYSTESWSILECIEHLNLYGDFYIPEIDKRLTLSERSPHAMEFKSGLVGNYFANLMKVENGKIRKMKSPRDKVPVLSTLNATTLDRFLKQQERTEKLLRQAQDKDLSRIKCAISLTPWIKLRLGDTFRVFVYHIERHVWQAENVLSQLPAEVKPF